MIETLRTPDERFTNLPGYDFEPNYIEVPGYEGLRGHYLDVGPKDSSEVFLCLHGEPSWSYLYRKMIPIFVEHGIRVIAPDWLGFGRSDKPVDEDVYTYEWHRNYMLGLIEKLDLQNVTLVCQDWGGVLGLTLPMEMPERFKRLLIMNTGLVLGPVDLPAFEEWKAEIESDENVPIHNIMKKHAEILTDEEADAYEAPYPDKTYKAGVRKFPQLLVNLEGTNTVAISQKAAQFWSEEWNGESFMAIGMKDEMLGPVVMRQMHQMIKNCPEPMEIPEAGHFVQEYGEEVARRALQTFGLAIG